MIHIPKARGKGGDLDTFFSRSGVLQAATQDLPHHPFIVFDQVDETVTVHVVRNLKDLLEFPDETALIVQWPGQFHSDFFKMVVGDVRDALDRLKRRSSDNVQIDQRRTQPNGRR